VSNSPINDSQLKQPRTDIEARVTTTRVLALIGYFGTMAFLMLWIIKLAPPQIPKSIALAISLLPLLLPLRGMIHGRALMRQYTEQKNNGLALCW